MCKNHGVSYMGAGSVNVEVIGLQDAPKGYAEFDSGVAKKFVIDPHGMIV